MNKRIMLPALLSVATSLYATGALAVPQVDGAGRPASTTCPATATVTTIQHFDKIIFKIIGKLIAPQGANTQPALDDLVAKNFGKLLDIKVIDNPLKIANLERKVLTFLGADPNNPDNQNAIEITDVEYASVVCPKGG